MNSEAHNRLHPHAPIVLAVTIGAFLFRLHDITGTSLWLDEILQADITSRPFGTIWEATHRDRLPLDYLLQALFLRLGTSELWVRLHACILGTLTLPMAFWLGRAGGGVRQGYVAMALWFALPVAVRFSREGSFYALLLFSHSWLLAALWEYYRRGRRARGRHAVQVALAASLCVWTSMHNWIAGAVAGGGIALLTLLRLLLTPRPFRRAALHAAARLTIAAAAAASVAIPLLVRYSRHASEPLHARFNGWSPALARMHWDVFTMGYDWTQYVHGASLALALLVPLAFVPGRSRRFVACCIVLAAATYGTVLFVLRKADHWVEVRYFIAALPPAIQVAAAGIVGVGNALERLLRRPGLASPTTTVLAATSLVAGAAYLERVPLPRTDWRGVAQYLAKASPPPAEILTVDYLDAAALPHYLEPNNLHPRITNLDWSRQALTEATIPESGRWLVHRTLWPTDPLHDAVRAYPVAREFTGVTLRRLQPWMQTLQEVAMAGKLPILGRTAQQFDLESAHESPARGAGWMDLEHWGTRQVRSVTGDGSDIGIVLDQPRELRVRLDVARYSEGGDPRPRLLLTSGKSTIEPDVDAETHVEFSIPASATRMGGQALTLRPTRTIIPRDYVTGSTDTRAFSFWVDRLSVEVAP